MPITKSDYDDLLARRRAGQICFMFDPAQCKNFLLQLDNAHAEQRLGYSFRLESRIIRLIAHVAEPGSLLIAIVFGFVWLKWWGLLLAPLTVGFSAVLKSVACGGRQRIFRPLVVFVAGISLAFLLRERGVAFDIFMSALSVLYLAGTLLYALPVWFFSSLIWSHYELMNAVYSVPIDQFNRGMGIPLMWHVETPGGRPPIAHSGLSRLLILCGFTRWQPHGRVRPDDST